MTKAQLKYFQSLSLTKNRKAYQQYLVEGDKNVIEWLQDGKNVVQVIATKEWLETHKGLIPNHLKSKCEEVPAFEIERISTLKTPTEVILVASFNQEKEIDWNNHEWFLALDAIRDPGNLGTIIRTADWFGIKNILLSADCVEVYNPKVVQASMGSLLRMNIVIADDLYTSLKNARKPVYITHLKGTDIRNFGELPAGIILMGNESKGVDEKYLDLAKELLFIPKFGAAESLNVAVATGVICAALIINKS